MAPEAPNPYASHCQPCQACEGLGDFYDELGDSFDCSKCSGTGEIWDSPEAKALSDTWQQDFFQ